MEKETIMSETTQELKKYDDTRSLNFKNVEQHQQDLKHDARTSFSKFFASSITASVPVISFLYFSTPNITLLLVSSFLALAASGYIGFKGMQRKTGIIVQETVKRIEPGVKKWLVTERGIDITDATVHALSKLMVKCELFSQYDAGSTPGMSTLWNTFRTREGEVFELEKVDEVWTAKKVSESPEPLSHVRTTGPLKVWGEHQPHPKKVIASQDSAKNNKMQDVKNENIEFKSATFITSEAQNLQKIINSKTELLRKQDLTTEEAYIVARAFKDSQEAVTLATQMADLNEDTAEQELTATLKLIAQDLDEVEQTKLSDIQQRMLEQRKHITGRSSAVSALKLKK